jgi:3-methyladenine DNA glycosylase AlkD
MTVDEILTELKAHGSQSYKDVIAKHGAVEPYFGVKIEYLKVLKKKLKVNQALAFELYETGVSEAMYLAGMIADPQKFTKPQLQKWAKAATWSMISEYIVAACAAESRFARELAKVWIDSSKELLATTGWMTLTHFISITPDEELDLDELRGLLAKVVQELPAERNRVRYCMNGFVIGVGCFVAPLVKEAKAAAKALGKVNVDVGDTSCKVPDALAYIEKVEAMGRLGRKKKEARC